MGIRLRDQERERRMKCGNQGSYPREETKREKDEVWESRELPRRRDQEREG